MLGLQGLGIQDFINQVLLFVGFNPFDFQSFGNFPELHQELVVKFNDVVHGNR